MTTKYLNTYKITAEITVQAETEQEAKTTVANLINSSRALGSSGQTLESKGRVAGVNKVQVQTLYQSEENKETQKEKQRDKELAEKEIERLEKEQGVKFTEANIPDEIIVKDPDTGTSRLVANPKKAEMEKKQQQEQQQEESQNQQQQQQQAQQNQKEEDQETPRQHYSRKIRGSTED